MGSEHIYKKQGPKTHIGKQGWELNIVTGTKIETEHRYRKKDGN